RLEPRPVCTIRRWTAGPGRGEHAGGRGWRFERRRFERGGSVSCSAFPRTAALDSRWALHPFGGRRLVGGRPGSIAAHVNGHDRASATVGVETRRYPSGCRSLATL